jgi:hypothetical protein
VLSSNTQLLSLEMQLVSVELLCGGCVCCSECAWKQQNMRVRSMRLPHQAAAFGCPALGFGVLAPSLVLGCSWELLLRWFCFNCRNCVR